MQRLKNKKIFSYLKKNRDIRDITDVDRWQEKNEDRKINIKERRRKGTRIQNGYVFFFQRQCQTKGGS